MRRKIDHELDHSALDFAMKQQIRMIGDGLANYRFTERWTILGQMVFFLFFSFPFLVLPCWGNQIPWISWECLQLGDISSGLGKEPNPLVASIYPARIRGIYTQVCRSRPFPLDATCESEGLDCQFSLDGGRRSLILSGGLIISNHPGKANSYPDGVAMILRYAASSSAGVNSGFPFTCKRDLFVLSIRRFNFPVRRIRKLQPKIYDHPKAVAPVCARLLVFFFMFLY
jgi:hypothetical protein